MFLDTPLYRCVRPSMIDDGCLSFRVFKSTNREPNKISVADGSRVTPENALQNYQKIHKNADGVVCVTVRDCRNLNLLILQTPKAHASYHCDIDLNGVDPDTASIELYYKAKNHGWVCQPDIPYQWLD